MAQMLEEIDKEVAAAGGRLQADRVGWEREGERERERAQQC